MITRRLARERSYSKRRKQETWQTFREPAEVPNRGFGALASLNEVRLRAGGAMTLESPHEGEILTYVHEGTLAYQDNLGRSGILQAGEFQCMTAGDHTRFDGTNPSRKQEAHVLQFWLGPSPTALEAKLEQQRFSAAERRGALHPVVSPDARKQSLRIQQDAVLFSGVFDPGQHVVHELHQGRRAWLQVIQGQLTLDDLVLDVGDGVGATSERSVSFTASSASEVLLLDLCAGPLHPEPLTLLLTRTSTSSDVMSTSASKKDRVDSAP